MPLHLRNSSERVPFSYLSSDLCLSVGSQVTTVHSCLLMLVALVVRQDILFQDVRRNKLQYLVHSRTRSKCCNSRNLQQMHILNPRKSILPWSITRCIPGHHAKFHDLLGEVMLLHINSHVPPFSLMCHQILPQFYCLEILGLLCGFSKQVVDQCLSHLFLLEVLLQLTRGVNSSVT